MSKAWEVLNLNRRSAPRFPARLPTSLSLAQQSNGFGHADRPPVIPGETRDISREGVGLIVPSLRTERHDLTRLDHLWRIVVALPFGHIQIVAMLVRFQRLQSDSPRSGYLIGVRIKEISDEDRRLFEDYLQSFENSTLATPSVVDIHVADADSH